MKAVILAAGKGSRLKDLTNDTPKCMIDVLGQPLIDRTISALIGCGVTEIVIVAGYQHEKLTGHLKKRFHNVRLTFILNPEYQTKENIYSLYLTIPYLADDDVLLLNSDIFCENALLKQAIAEPNNTMVVDKHVKFTQEATKVMIDESGYISYISKEIPAKQTHGEDIGIIKLLSKSTALYFEQISQMVKNSNVHIWYPYALNMILTDIKLKPIYTDGMLWEEIDTISDYKRAVRKAKKLK